jgi:hypothetical protein
MLPQVDFDNTAEVSEFVRAQFSGIYAGADDRWLRRVFVDVEDMFAGRNPAYLPIDLKYHNLRHTLMATACMSTLLEGHHAANADTRLTARDFELAIAGVMLHDTGYLKLKTDSKGTGAKYTFCHILRSCAFAASYLPEVGVNDVELENVLSAINCTGPQSEIGRLLFRDSVSRVVGCALATADYLAQLADPQYPDKLGALFAEFCESDDYSNVPPQRRVFKSEEDLVRRTPGFWLKFVKPKLDGDFQSAYRYLERPLGSGKNNYLDAVAVNLARIEEMIADLKPGGA